MSAEQTTQMIIAASRMENPGSSPTGNGSFGWFDDKKVSTDELNSVFPLREGAGREMSYEARIAVANRLSEVVEPEKREAFVASMGMAESADGVLRVLVENDVPQKIGEKVAKEINSTELNTKVAKTAGVVLAKYVPKGERTAFKKASTEAKTVGDLVKVVQKYEVDTELALRSAKFKKMGKVAVPVILGLASCLAVPNVDPNAVAQPDMFHAYLLAHPNDVILSATKWGGAIGGVASIVENGWTYIQSVRHANEEHPPMAIHSALASIATDAFLETFENSMKAGAATTGLSVFAGGVDVQQVETIGTVLSTGLGVQTIIELFTEPLSKIKNLRV